VPSNEDLDAKLKRLDAMLAETETLSKVGSWHWDVRHDRLHWTRGLYAIYDVPEGTITCLEDYQAIMTPDRRADFKALLARALADHQPYVFECWIERANGDRCFVRCRGRVVVGADGRPEQMLGAVQDLTEQKLADEALLTSEAKLRAIVDASPDLVIIRDLDGNYLMLNDTVALSLAIPRDRLEGANIRDVFDERTVADVVKADHDVVELHATVRTELDATTREGRRRIFESTKYPYVLPSGEVGGIISISRDITELRELEGLLHQRNEEFKAFVESSPDVIARIDRHHRVVYLNPGSGGSGIMGHSVWDLGLAPEESRSFALAVDHVFNTGEQVQRHVRYDLPEGERWYHSRMFPERAPGGGVEHVLVMARDVTDSKRANLELEEQKTLLERIVRYAPFGVAYLDRQSVYRWVNPAYAALFDRPLESFQGHTVWELFPERVEPGPAFQHSLETGVPYTATAMPAKVKVGGELRQTYWDVAYVPIPDEANRVVGLLVLAQEVTDRVETERLRAAQMRRLEQLDEFRRVLVSAVSHELRTPLTSVVGYAEFLEDEIAGELNREQRAFLDAIKGGVFRLRRIVDDLLDVDRLENGTFTLEQQPVDFRQELDDTLKELRPQIEAATIEVVVDAPEGPLVAPIDAARVGQVLVNLLSNAIKFTPARGRIGVKVARTGQELVVSITDSGPGIQPEDLPRLFQRFGQLDEGKRKGGTGLGLFISKALVEAHGGSIGVDSTPGAGSTFWFTLPSG
jgi:PAS domain S-box-containing protein